MTLAGGEQEQRVWKRGQEYAQQLRECGADSTAAVKLVEEAATDPLLLCGYGALLAVARKGNLPDDSLALLRWLAWGTLRQRPSFRTLSLTEALLDKMRRLTFLSLATQSLWLPYAALRDELEIEEQEELEEWLIEVVEEGVVVGQLDTDQQAFLVQALPYVRDVDERRLQQMETRVNEWEANIRATLEVLDRAIEAMRAAAQTARATSRRMTPAPAYPQERPGGAEGCSDEESSEEAGSIAAVDPATAAAAASVALPLRSHRTVRERPTLTSDAETSPEQMEASPGLATGTRRKRRSGRD
ncbi:hypothetical protein CDCA_CDCA09G2742 [Cyanidium caldarium]|uniref:PCI domain-containing protein n=1 Tax=Cyanidium caldarium TaxID=2771 RepID=A0AAV9IWK9_CYACA|nr:hypothetical protein CDCA_CDCA09G2742 [Cyanidium caldarium]|eukprot:ctg_235.g139